MRRFTSLAQCHTISDIFPTEVAQDLGAQASIRPQQAVFHPSSLLESPGALLLFAPSLFQETRQVVKQGRKLIDDGRTLLLVFSAAAHLNKETSLSQVGASSGVICFRCSCKSESCFLQVCIRASKSLTSCGEYVIFPLSTVSCILSSVWPILTRSFWL